MQMQRPDVLAILDEGKTGETILYKMNSRTIWF